MQPASGPLHPGAYWDRLALELLGPADPSRRPRPPQVPDKQPPLCSTDVALEGQEGALWCFPQDVSGPLGLTLTLSCPLTKGRSVPGQKLSSGADPPQCQALPGQRAEAECCPCMPSGLWELQVR